MRRSLAVLVLAAGIAVIPAACSARMSATPTVVAGYGPSGVAGLPERAVRRDIPMTNSIRRAFAAATRDSTGRPGRNYWQLETDYTINARLDPATSRISGRETVVIHNGSPDTLFQIVLRLDANHFLWNVPRAAPWVPAEQTDGMVITSMLVDGRAVNLAPPPAVRGQAAAPVTEHRAFGLASTQARVNLATPIAPRGKATLAIEWSHKLPGGPGVGHRMTQRWGDTLYQPTQWFPRVAVYDDLRGWDPSCTSAHRSSTITSAASTCASTCRLDGS